MVSPLPTRDGPGQSRRSLLLTGTVLSGVPGSLFHPHSGTPSFTGIQLQLPRLRAAYVVEPREHIAFIVSSHMQRLRLGWPSGQSHRASSGGLELPSSDAAFSRTNDESRVAGKGGVPKVGTGGKYFCSNTTPYARCSSHSDGENCPSMCPPT